MFKKGVIYLSMFRYSIIPDLTTLMLMKNSRPRNSLNIDPSTDLKTYRFGFILLKFENKFNICDNS